MFASDTSVSIPAFEAPTNYVDLYPQMTTASRMLVICIASAYSLYVVISSEISSSGVYSAFWVPVILASMVAPTFCAGFWTVDSWLINSGYGTFQSRCSLAKDQRTTKDSSNSLTRMLTTCMVKFKLDYMDVMCKDLWPDYLPPPWRIEISSFRGSRRVGSNPSLCSLSLEWMFRA